MNPLSLLLNDELLEFVERVAQEDYSLCEGEDDMPVFYGQLFNENDVFMDESEYPEDQFFGMCMSCGNTYPIFFKHDIPKDGEETTCPHCGSHGILYDFHLSDVPEMNISQPLAILDTIEGGYVLRVFSSSVSFDMRETDRYDTLYCEPQIMIREVSREYYVNGDVYYYRNHSWEVVFDDDGACFEQADKPDDDDLFAWIINWDNPYNPMCGSTVDELIAELPYKVNTFAEFLQKKVPLSTLHLLQRYGFVKLLESLLYIPHELIGKNITDVLRVDYNQIKAHFDVSKFDMDDLYAVRKLVEMGLQISEKNGQIMRILMGTKVLDECDDIKRMFKYLRNQMERSGSKEIARDYHDYLRDCKKIGYDLTESSVRYPTDLDTTHRRTQQLARMTNSALTEKKVRDVYEKLHANCEWSDGVYMVVMPTCCMDIIEEGAQQNHCVGNYCERVAAGEDLILFLRKVSEPDKAFYTVEIRPNMRKLDIVQCRGFRNTDQSSEVRAAVDAFLQKYAIWFSTRKPKKGKTKMLRKYYKAVRKTEDGRYISNWDKKTEFFVGKVITATTNSDPDKVAVQGIHIASLDFAKQYGDSWPDVAILEIEVNMKDVVVPNAKDQVRTSKGLVIREVPYEELGEWGKRHMKMVTAVA